MGQSWTEIPGGVTAPRGFRAAGAAVGLKPSGGLDLALVVSEVEAIAAGTLTRNAVKAACVTYDRAILAAGKPVRAILCNAGQANACTGAEGDRDNAKMAQLAAQALGVEPMQVFTASTGVIGQRIDLTKLEHSIPALAARVASDADLDGGTTAAKAILTTDLTDKTVALEAQLGDRVIRMGGMAKGSGMIHPNMATMLAFITCDAAVDPMTWQTMVSGAVDASFNQITVDCDTSTNDMVLALANGQSGGLPIVADAPEAEGLAGMLEAVCIHLAKAIARDGEGATKLLEVCVRGAEDVASARQIARTIASSPLVKAAAYGNDPNWGRIAMAAGRAGVPFDDRALDIFLGKFQLMQAGKPLPFDRAAASDYLKGDPVAIGVDLHRGEASGVAWGCDLSYDYVRINAEYTT
ncbi:bifunctional glutamate N-acetyltransferase/amino-acid acetyltransferase ArgJ [Synechococcus sp. PCC 7336]|uniref:bifunctional glutamate N-acetyltransferase/amino-acid acetyltransferase ArgJ n=1 Tax=Synechococcus sp. PCC 7336 TaxID=195250 RepID=UPI0004763850|nr:bifunctional glutamate N-acetyltransferase/amino-acid acetyltransferase ArgJ [Synechococcus sp. PCC 7336]